VKQPVYLQVSTPILRQVAPRRNTRRFANYSWSIAHKRGKCGKCKYLE